MGFVSRPTTEHTDGIAAPATQLVGIAMMRYVWQIGPLAAVPSEVVVACLTPVIEHYLNDTLRD